MMNDHGLLMYYKDKNSNDASSFCDTECSMLDSEWIKKGTFLRILYLFLASSL